MKKLLTTLILFFIVIYPASSLKTFEINETEKISLAPKAEDPDADILIYTFTSPLDENGEWQTTYGDAGEYTATITVSDGESEVSEEVMIIVNRKEAMPTIDSFEPVENSVSIDEGQSIKFVVEASDLNNDELSYRWDIDNEIVSESKEMVFDTGYKDDGRYDVSVIVSDGVFDVSKEWDLTVDDVDLDALLDQIKDITVLETETASLELPDFSQYKLAYSISEPIGSDNKWETKFDDAGEYFVTVIAEGKDFKEEKEVKIIVLNKDRAPEFVGLRNARVRENQELRIELNVVDPDNDELFFSAEDIPQNAQLDGNLFTWTPSFDTVQKNNVWDYILEKFRLLKGNINVVFVVQSNELSAKKNVKITIKDENRPFVLEKIEDIEVDEGQEIVINPGYNDPDLDKVSFKYSGLMTRNKKTTNFEDAGSYIVKVTASDGLFTQTRFVNVKVNDVNRAPVFDEIGNMKVDEGEEIRIVLQASDPDNDAVSFSADNLPKGAKLRDNLFIWKPDFDTVAGVEREFSVEFIVDDGSEEDRENMVITVLNKNRAPKIVDTSNNLIVFKDQETLFEVTAIDEDGDSLTYEWNFGFLDKFESENKHQRIFTKIGSKKVEVTVSDGMGSVTKVWKVEVV